MLLIWILCEWSEFNKKVQKLSGKYQVTNDFPADKICQMVFLDGFIERIKWGLVFLEQINGFQTRIHGTAKRL